MPALHAINSLSFKLGRHLCKHQAWPHDIGLFESESRLCFGSCQVSGTGRDSPRGKDGRASIASRLTHAAQRGRHSHVDTEASHMSSMIRSVAQT
ncbi:hypothetical protein P389DRAFT_22205 [Cystobasidium minutum MCA 4210]|uniref:uncharacterized protein n=1 Tax=Cystobasidium minutum MCA 4210 TaxID=1397322 RepID=UPI0034CFC777|eukprot:jgi/Rhomi1/22205/CE22204_399